MLELGVLPRVSAATAALMVLFTSAQFIIAGRLRLDYALWYGGVGALATVVGQSAASWYIRKYNRQSVIILSLALVIGVSAVAMGLVGLVEAAQAALTEDRVWHWDAFYLHDLCEAW